MKEKESKDSIGNVVPINGASLPEVSATVAFIDIKSANKAHSAKNALDGRTLKTDYYTPSSSSSTTNASSQQLTEASSTGTSTVAKPNADPPEKESPLDFDERSQSHSSSSRAPLKSRHCQRYCTLFFHNLTLRYLVQNIFRQIEGKNCTKNISIDVPSICRQKCEKSMVFEFLNRLLRRRGCELVRLSSPVYHGEKSMD